MTLTDMAQFATNIHGPDYESLSSGDQILTTVSCQESNPQGLFDLLPWYGWLCVLIVIMVLALSFLLFVFIKRRSHGSQSVG